jgi:hypothetical protein
VAKGEYPRISKGGHPQTPKVGLIEKLSENINFSHVHLFGHVKNRQIGNNTEITSGKYICEQ